ncbi:hypothetical protein LX32DRAFT_657254 [Colletotrichum zoysiae]|uniref:Uncharacterized protein n=1 Tax=Colletotrichum zoysiae TaxID=1216348 RepID=A0AAD9H6E1_9PEZI|nr:hypothetical protein LX32DRAFT_657254 [Colletotrichum zoysiae]
MAGQIKGWLLVTIVGVGGEMYFIGGSQPGWLVSLTAYANALAAKTLWIPPAWTGRINLGSNKDDEDTDVLVRYRGKTGSNGISQPDLIRRLKSGIQPNAANLRSRMAIRRAYSFASRKVKRQRGC